MSWCAEELIFGDCVYPWHSYVGRVGRCRNKKRDSIEVESNNKKGGSDQEASIKSCSHLRRGLYRGSHMWFHPPNN